MNCLRSIRISRNCNKILLYKSYEYCHNMPTLYHFIKVAYHGNYPHNTNDNAESRSNPITDPVAPYEEMINNELKVDHNIRFERERRRYKKIEKNACIGLVIFMLFVAYIIYYNKYIIYKDYVNLYTVPVDERRKMNKSKDKHDTEAYMLNMRNK